MLADFDNQNKFQKYQFKFFVVPIRYIFIMIGSTNIVQWLIISRVLNFLYGENTMYIYRFCLCLILMFQLDSGSLLTKRYDVLSPNLVRSRSRSIGCYNDRIALKLTDISTVLLPRCLSCQILERLDKYKPESHGFEILRDLTLRRPSAKWKKALSHWYINPLYTTGQAFPTHHACCKSMLHHKPTCQLICM